MDKAAQTTELLIKEWEETTKDATRYIQLCDSIFVPFTIRILDEEDKQIIHLLEHRESGQGGITRDSVS